MADDMNKGLDFAEEDPYYWRFMNDKAVTKGVDEMVKEIMASNEQLQKMVPENSYTNIFAAAGFYGPGKRRIHSSAVCTE